MASNVVTTVSTTRSDMGSSTVLDGFLKDVYGPAITNTLFYNDDFTRHIQKTTRGLQADGRRIVHPFRTQRSAGVGPIAEGGDWRDSVPPKASQGYEWIKYLNLYFSLSGPAYRTINEGVGSYVDSATESIMSIGQSAQLDLERQLQGQADGRLCQLASGSAVTGTTLTVEGPAFFDTQFVEPGMYIEFRDNSFGTPTLRTAIDGTNSYATVASTTKGWKRTSATSGTVETNETLTANVTALDWIMRKGAWISTTSCLEINGLMNLISDGSSTCLTYVGAESTSNFTSIWNKNRTTTGNEYLQSYIWDVSGELDEDKLLQALVELKNQTQAKPNMFLVDERSAATYFLNQEGDRRFNVADRTFVGGYKSLGIQLGSTLMMLKTMASVPKGVAYFLNTNDFAFITATNGYEWVTKEGGKIVTQKEGSDNVFASAVNYLQFVCYDPQKQGKIYGITASI